MIQIPSFNALIQKSIIDNWDRDALTDFKGQTLQYHDVARKIEKIHILFENSGIQKGDKIALCGRNSSQWAVAFLATLTYGAIAVPILHEFNAEQIHNIVNHSEARLLFVGDHVATIIDPQAMPTLEGIINNPDYSLKISRTDKLTYAREHLNELYGKKFPKYFRKEHVNYYKEESPEELAVINYTSGTTGFSKGVMLPYRALWSNYDFAYSVLGKTIKAGDPVISMLPMVHMYGMAFEFIFEFLHGCHVFYLNRVPSPAIIAQALQEVKPVIVIAVPLIIEKIVRKKVFPKVQNNRMRLLLQMPVISKKVREMICQEVLKAFGGRMYEVIIGGAALHQQVKIVSPDPQRIPGEILTKGPNVMLGYYKNPEATAETIDNDGWYHTGDLGTMDLDGNVFINGRSKNMLLGPNGQNIYPEEIEDKLNSMTLVMESIVVQRDNKLVALVHPDMEEAKNMGFSDEDLRNVMEQNRNGLNEIIPAYEKITEIEIHEEEFEKTPKKSIKRYLYT